MTGTSRAEARIEILTDAANIDGISHNAPKDSAAFAATQHETLTNSSTPNGTSSYHPYKSPLSSFQSFRYNEQFSKAPPATGFRSLTYSNNIDPKVPLCPTELSGDVCVDAMCEEQHFRHLGLSGENIGPKPVNE